MKVVEIEAQSQNPGLRGAALLMLVARWWPLPGCNDAEDAPFERAGSVRIENAGPHSAQYPTPFARPRTFCFPGARTGLEVRDDRADGFTCKAAEVDTFAKVQWKAAGQRRKGGT